MRYPCHGPGSATATYPAFLIVFCGRDYIPRSIDVQGEESPSNLTPCSPTAGVQSSPVMARPFLVQNSDDSNKEGSSETQVRNGSCVGNRGVKTIPVWYAIVRDSLMVPVGELVAVTPADPGVLLLVRSPRRELVGGRVGTRDGRRRIGYSTSTPHHRSRGILIRECSCCILFTFA